MWLFFVVSKNDTQTRESHISTRYVYAEIGWWDAKSQEYGWGLVAIRHSRGWALTNMCVCVNIRLLYAHSCTALFFFKSSGGFSGKFFFCLLAELKFSAHFTGYCALKSN